MGNRIHGQTKMKLFIVAAVLIASVFAEPESEAEAKPWLTYGAGYAGYPYASTYAAYPYAGVYGAGVYGAGVYGAGYNGYALGAHYLGKRSAEAEAEPEAWYGAYNGYAGYGYGSRYAGY